MENRKKRFQAKLSDDKLTVEYDKDDFSTTLPNLTDELNDQNNPGKVPINDIRFEDEIPNDPGLNDFLRRCTKKREAREIIDYLEKRGEISSEEAKETRKKLESKGLDSFGPHKSYGYYERTYRRRFQH